MPIGSGKVTVRNERFVSKRKTTPVAHPKDNTSDLEIAALKAHQQFAHISKPDDGAKSRTRRGSLDSGNAAMFSGTVVVAPTSGSTGSSGGA